MLGSIPGINAEAEANPEGPAPSPAPSNPAIRPGNALVLPPPGVVAVVPEAGFGICPLGAMNDGVLGAITPAPTGTDGIGLGGLARFSPEPTLLGPLPLAFPLVIVVCPCCLVSCLFLPLRVPLPPSRSRLSLVLPLPTLPVQFGLTSSPTHLGMKE
jgi:hypothetical protein